MPSIVHIFHYRLNWATLLSVRILIADVHEYFIKTVIFAGQMTAMLCGQAEIELYIESLANASSRSNPRISPNCNQNSWALGCQPGWACMVSGTEPSDGPSAELVPQRAESCRPCCPGFFCPRGLTCMMRKFSLNKPRQTYWTHFA